MGRVADRRRSTDVGIVVREAVDDATRAFVRERHLASLTLVRTDGRPHVTPVGFTWDDDTGIVRVITWAGSVKARLLDAAGSLEAAVCQVDGGRWVTFAGPAIVSADPDRCAEAVRRYGERYRPPADRGADRRVIELTPHEILGRT